MRATAIGDTECSGNFGVARTKSVGCTQYNCASSESKQVRKFGHGGGGGGEQGHDMPVVTVHSINRADSSRAFVASPCPRSAVGVACVPTVTK